MLRRALIVLTAVGLSACEFPTAPPQWEQEWQVPIDSVRLSVAELLPEGVGLTEDSTAFVVTAPGTSMSVTLGEICELCPTGSTFVPVKPEFSDTISTSTSLPGDLVSATLAGGAFQAELTHTFSFDPLRPSASGPNGYLVVRISSNGVEVAADSIHGDDQAFPANTPLIPDLQIAPVDITNNLDIQVVIYSPEGDGTTLDSSDSLVVTLHPTEILISEATVNLTTATIGPETQTMDFAVDSALVNRLQRGALLIDIENDFPVAGTLSIGFNVGAQTIGETITLAQGTSQTRVEFTGEELRQILGAGTVEAEVSGSIGGAGGTITITPTQELVMAMAFELIVLVGGTGEEN